MYSLWLLFATGYRYSYVIDTTQLELTHGVAYLDGVAAAVEQVQVVYRLLYLVGSSPAATLPLSVGIGHCDVDGVTCSNVVGRGVVDKKPKVAIGIIAVVSNKKFDIVACRCRYFYGKLFGVIHFPSVGFYGSVRVVYLVAHASR